MSQETRSIPRLVIAGTASGVGKTTMMTSLTLALTSLGLKVATFKCGPDYLDPTYHAKTSGRPCLNLDGWMMGRDAVLATFERGSAGADIALIEGVMGLFDGASPTGEAGSAAEIAKWLDAPVALVIDASGMARSIAATALGFATFDPGVKIGAILASRVGSRSHDQLLRQASRAAGLSAIYGGGLPETPEITLASRHLGLTSARHGGLSDEQMRRLRELGAEWLDLEGLEGVARTAPPLPLREEGAGAVDRGSWNSGSLDSGSVNKNSRGSKPRIAIAWDEAFDFYYEDNLRRLEAAGAELVYFSPVHDQTLPDCEALWLGGGYPELKAEALAQNHTMKEAITKWAADGGLIYAECGGLIYLAQSLTLTSGVTWPMLGILPGQVIMGDKLKALGYVEVETQAASWLGGAGTRFRGHQFRYSELQIEETASPPLIYSVRRRRDQKTFAEGYQRGTVLGSYVHAHWASNPQIPVHMVEKAAARRRGGHG